MGIITQNKHIRPTFPAGKFRSESSERIQDFLDSGLIDFKEHGVSEHDASGLSQ